MGENSGERPGSPEAEKKNIAVRFFERWQKEFTRAKDAINASDHEARAKLATLNADVLRRAGLRETAYGIALTSLNVVTAGFGAGLGMLGGAVGGAATGAVLGGIGGALGMLPTGPGVVPAFVIGAGIGGYSGLIAGGIAGSVLGNQVGVELAGWAYSKFVRKLDMEAQPLTKVDWLVGQVPGLNPPIVGGIRTMFEGFFGLAAKREEAGMKAMAAA